MNSDLVFEIIFDNENYFTDIDVREAKVLLCTYKPLREKSYITTPIELDNGRELCNTIYNTIRENIINAKYTVFKNGNKDNINYDIDFSDIVDEYYKLSDIAKEEAHRIALSDYLEFLKPCAIYMAEKEDIIMAQNYNKLLDIIDIIVDYKIIAKHRECVEEFGEYEEYYIKIMLGIHKNF
tara:strand:+ start:667 stop:1209 length:543 start_codon:yes stop_codon:yes gene_type:complete